jgi:hypothetical protein
MIAKALLNLDRVVYTLDPHFDPNIIIRERATRYCNATSSRVLLQTICLSGVVDLKEFVEKLPNESKSDSRFGRKQRTSFQGRCDRREKL